MDLNSTIDIIIKDLNEARDIIDDLKKYSGVPELQVELAKSKCRSASEVIALLKNQETKSFSAREERTVVLEETDVQKEPEIPENVMPASPLNKEILLEATVSEVLTVSKEETIIPVMKPAEQAIIADQFSNRPESFNEKLGSMKHDEDVLEILHTKPLSSLNEAIGINDKFLFVREIFNGNQESYHQAISKLESVGTLSDALVIIMSYTGENSSNEAVKQLLDLIKRKFPSHE
jgi:hypothetical protein